MVAARQVVWWFDSTVGHEVFTLEESTLIVIAFLLAFIALWVRAIHVRLKKQARRMENRGVLPVNTGDTVVTKGASAMITARPQRGAFRPDRFIVMNARDWIVNEIKIANRSQFAQAGDIPGDMFASNAIDGFVSFEEAAVGADISIVVTYIGADPEGAVFYGSMVGTESSARRRRGTSRTA